MTASKTPPYEFLGETQDTTIGTRMRLYTIRQSGFPSYLEIKIQARYSEAFQHIPDTNEASLFLTSAGWVSWSARQIVCCGDDTPVPENCGVAPAGLKDQHGKFDHMVQQGKVWELDLQWDPNHLHASNLFSSVHEHPQAHVMRRLRDYLTAESHLKFFVFGTDLKPALEEQWDRMRADVDVDISYVRQWYPQARGKPVFQKGQEAPRDQRPLTNFVMRNTFADRTEYGTCLHNALVYEQEARDLAALAVSEACSELLVVTVPNLGNRRYIAFLALPDYCGTRLQPDDRLKLVFDLENSAPEKGWHAIVTENIGFTPPGFYALSLTRPWDSETSTWVELPPDQEPKAIPFSAMTDLKRARRILASIQPQSVVAFLSCSRRPYSRQVTALRTLSDCAATKPNIWQMLLGNKPLALPPVDIYKNLVGDFSATVLPARFNASQQAILAGMRQAPGGFALVQGPPGTGKSYTACWLAMPFLVCTPKIAPLGRTRQQVLMVTPSNEAGNDLACTAQEVANTVVTDRQAMVIRLHASETEVDMALHLADRERPAAPNARPPIQQGELAEAVAQMMIARSLIEWYEKATFNPSPVIDKRVVNIQQSLGYRALQVAGYIPSPWSQPVKYAEFRRFVDLYQEGAVFNAKEQESFTKTVKNLLRDTLRLADIVVATTFGASQPLVVDSLQPELIVVDEAARATEPELWPVLAHYNPQGYLLIGDPFQLHPVVISTPENNPLHHVSGTSLFWRLHLSGMLMGMLSEQYRMAPRLGQLISTLFYHGQLQSAPRLPPRLEHISEQITSLNYQLFRVRQPFVLVDMTKSCEARDDRHSRSNTDHRLFGVCLLRCLLQAQLMHPTDIVYLTPYTAQCNAIRATLSSLQLQEPTVGFGRVPVKTIDSFQGGEAPLVIFDTTATEGPGFLKQRSRLNVALSRARAAMYVIVNVKQWNKAKESQRGRYVGPMIDDFVHSKCRVRIPPAIMDEMNRLAAEERDAEFEDTPIPEGFEARHEHTGPSGDPFGDIDKEPTEPAAADDIDTAEGIEDMTSDSGVPYLPSVDEESTGPAAADDMDIAKGNEDITSDSGVAYLPPVDWDVEQPDASAVDLFQAPCAATGSPEDPAGTGCSAGAVYGSIFAADNEKW